MERAGKWSFLKRPWFFSVCYASVVCYQRSAYRLTATVAATNVGSWWRRNLLMRLGLHPGLTPPYRNRPLFFLSAWFSKRKMCVKWSKYDKNNTTYLQTKLKNEKRRSARRKEELVQLPTNWKKNRSCIILYPTRFQCWARKEELRRANSLNN